MSISSIMHAEEDDLFYIKQEEYGFEEDDESTTTTSPAAKRRRRLSDSTLHQLPTTRSSVDTTSDSASTTHSTQSLPSAFNNNNNNSNSNTSLIHPHIHSPFNHNNNTPPVVIRPLPRVLPSPTIPPPPQVTANTQSNTDTSNSRRDNILAESLLQVTREKEAGRMKRSQDMLQFLREKRIERDQLLIEKELTKRVKAKAELVKNLMDAGFDKNAIAEQLNML